MDTSALDPLAWIIAIFGLVALGGIFFRMQGGFGPNNLRVLGIVVVATLASLLALQGEKSVTAAMGILGGIAGYLFGLKDKQDT